MIRKPFALILFLGLAACGVDGEPIRPSVAASVGIGSSGVHSNVGVGVNSGPVSIFLGL